MLDIKDLNTKKDILIELNKAEQSISKITKDICIYYRDYVFISHLLQSTGLLRDSISSLSQDIIKQSKNEEISKLKKEN
jgi:hypothetical protein